MIKNPPIIKQVVKEMGGTIEKIVPERGCFLIKINGEEIFVSRKFQIASDFLSGKALTAYKDLTYVMLKKNNLPTPQTVCFYRKTLNATDLDKKLATLNYPIVVKDANGSNSKGVFTDIKSEIEAKRLIQKEINNFRFLIAQEMVFGKEYRVLILKDKAIGVLEMIPPRIFGDGKNTVRTLITKKQEKTQSRTKFDSSLNKILQQQGVNIESILEKGKEVFLKKNSCLAEGGETRDMTDQINPTIKNICVKAAQSTGKYLAGIDLICDDITKSPDQQNTNILEINGKPDLYIHYNPTHGETRDVIRSIINFIIDIKKEQ